MRPNKLTKLFAVATLGVLLIAPPVFAAKKAPKATELEAPVTDAIVVSDYELNTFVFPSVIKRIFFPAEAPVKGKPIYFAGNTQVMLQFAKGAERPVQMVAELEGGAVVSLRVAPRPVPGIVHAVNGARVRGSLPARRPDMDTRQGTAPRGEDIELLKFLIAKHEPPAGFEAVKLPGPIRFDKFSVVPLAAWSDGAAKRVLIFSLVAVPGQTAVVSPPQFYRAGINAVMLDGDVVDDTNTPQLFVVEELGDE